MTIFYTSDTHFNHNNIIEMENRPFKDKVEMEEYIITKWNRQVKPTDTVIHVGDFALASYTKIVSLLEQLNGEFILVGGNHDKDTIWLRLEKERPDLLKQYHPVGYKEQWGKDWVWFTHFPTEIRVRNGKWSIHGHIHGEESTYLNQINVGIDSPHFKHLPFGQLLTRQDILTVMNKRSLRISETATRK